MRKLKPSRSNCNGFTLVEVVIVISVFAIAIPVLVQLTSTTLENSHKSALVSKAVLFAQEKMEQILADKRDPNKGYDWVTTPGRYSNDSPETGFTRSVTLTTGNSNNGISYAYVEVEVTHSEVADVTLTTWLTDY